MLTPLLNGYNVVQNRITEGNMQTLQEADNLSKPTRDVVRSQRWTEEQWQEIKQAAKAAGMGEANFVRGCALSQAREINSKKRKGK